MLAHQYANPTTPSRIVVLGARGFLASEIRRMLDGAEIPCRAVPSSEVDLTSGESPAELARILRPDDVLIVTSALTPDKGRDAATLLKNVRMGENLAALLDRGRCAHVIYVSSDGIYDSRLSLVSEESPCETGDMYAVAHVVREKILLNACQKAGIPLTFVRPSAIYGAGDTHNSYGPNRFIRTALKEGKIVLFGGGEERRDHIHVSDVAAIMLRCALRRSTGVINAVTGRALSFRQAAELVATAAASPVHIEELPRGGPVTHRHYDVTALISAFPDFQPLSPERGIAEALAGMRQSVSSV
jgi:UDP-glucose 4-epimerase